MDRFRRSLRLKVLGLVLSITLSALLMSAAGLVIYDLRSYERQTSADLMAQAQVLARASAPALSFGDHRTAQKDLSVVQVRAPVQAAALYGRDGLLFATYARAGVPPSFPARPSVPGYQIDGDEISVFQAVEENGEVVGTIYLRANYEPLGRLFDYLTILLGVTIASLGVAALLSGWLQRGITEPILDMAKMARRVMAERDYAQRTRKTTDDEIGELVDAFNAMLAEIGRRNEELRLADRRKDEFLATLAHELRNPLAPIRNALEILRLVGDDPVKSERAREMMQRQLAQMVRLVDDLLDVSRITTGKLAVRKSVIDLNAAIRDAVEIARPFVESRRHTMEIRQTEASVPVEGDKTRLAQVFSNLLNNAAKYTDPGGHILLQVSVEGGDAVVRVKDNGVGLDPESLDQIFDMFVQVDRSLERSQAGLGVGLTLSKRLIELHGGTVEARSEGRGKGSEFIVRLPTTYVRLDSVEGPSSIAEQGVAGRRVLLADDNADFANSLGQLLQTQGHTVRIAYDGVEALVAADEFQPDVAFVDIGMPKMHGYEVARRLKAGKLASCYLVAVTGWGQENDRRRSREAGFDRHLVKPVDPHEIQAILAMR